jgi:hypothetical protein
MNTKNLLPYPYEMDSKFSKLIQSIFTEDLIVSFITGRAAFFLTDKDMDIDIMIVLNDSIVNRQNTFRKKWEQFVIGYRDIHIEYGFKPDNAFPGDFTTVSQIYDVISGRGFSYQNNTIIMKPMNSIEDESDENDYRIFRSMFITGRSICGNSAFLEEMKEKSIEVLIKYFFITNPVQSCTKIINELLRGKEKEMYGYDMRYEPYFSTYIEPYIKIILTKLERQGYIEKIHDGAYKANDTINLWSTIIGKRIWNSFHLMPFHDDYYVKRRNEIFKNYKGGSHWDKI